MPTQPNTHLLVLEGSTREENKKLPILLKTGLEEPVYCNFLSEQQEGITCSMGVATLVMQSGEGGVGSGEGGVKSSEVVTFGREQCSSSGFVRPVHQEVPKLNEVPLDIICTGKCTMALTPTAMSTHTHCTHAHCTLLLY